MKKRMPTKKELIAAHDKAMRAVTLEKLIDEGLKLPEVLDAFAKRRSPEESKFVELARFNAQYVQESCDCQIEIDDNAFVSMPETDESVEPHAGAFVLSWMWVDKDEDEDE